MGIAIKEERDPGLQPERTQLSWQRTAFSMMVPAALTFRGWLHFGEWPYAIVAVILMSCASLMLLNQYGKNKLYVSFSVILSSLFLGFLFLCRLFEII
ncbi:TPA: DUF202 domain-containing protein [Citrobacter werkmanii]|uniref:DUF202 domain-containing protein n=1 Tax=Citrobacter werkmanii TaxID=67827 RepID=UPI00076E6DEC|nr:DUF202 domain-containing protein [Citrobacter werkmanii]MDN8558272.1 DUF202 domain-containing protein [Citrobacter werkmanii]GAS72194.1 hypothetical protein NGUA40_01801 [Salmonella enterica]GAS75422.1 hypothetical protein NGUA41_00260 [Salmonella enterica]HAT7567954.1 DUF202 domain-containing protein [Citrobacter werkmanii]